jgi:hypothetical protein
MEILSIFKHRPNNRKGMQGNISGIKALEIAFACLRSPKEEKATYKVKKSTRNKSLILT